jgi:ribosomal protein S18 acetylase RimI-like enzyme
MSFIVRLMTLDDLAAIEVIQSEAYAGYFLESAEVIAQRFDLSPTTAWVAEREGQVCAYLVGYWSTIGKINPLNAPFSFIAEPNCLYLHDLALSKSAQGFGLGKKLIHAATECAMENKAQALALLSVQNSKDFWQNFGFSEFFELEEVQQENLNTYLNGNNSAFYMVKRL